ncbi:MAG: EAL domain-containing protein [Spirochaetales bacterium]|nr:EAL domain-containing protein [Spirochaetales bacterium]
MIRVLMLEDSDDDADLILRELERFEISFAHERTSDGDSFTQMLKDFGPDIVLSDYSLPGYDGMAALAHCRELYPDLPFIFVSGTMGEEVAVEALREGATDYVLKDRLKRLGPAVRRALQAVKDANLARNFQNELRLRSAALNAAANAVMITDREGRISWVNAAWERLTGYSPEEVIGKLPSIIKSGAHEPEYYRNLWTTILEGQVWRGELINQRRDGSLYTEEQTITPLLDESGQITHFIAIKQDITERKTHLWRIERLSRIHEVLSSINSLIVRAPEEKELFEECCRIAVEAGRFDIALLDRIIDGKSIENQAASGHPEEHVQRLARATQINLENPDSLIGQAVRSGQIGFSNNIDTDAHFKSDRRELAIEMGYRSLVVLPLSADNRVVATLSLVSGTANLFDQDELRLLGELAADVSFALEHQKRRAQANFLAFHHPSTGLPNRLHFEQQLGMQLRNRAVEHRQAALAVLDLERFRYVNETLGRHAGDLLLRSVARRLTEAAGNDLLVAHLERDHFGLFFVDIVEAEEVLQRLNDLRERCFAAPFDIQEQDLLVSCRAGIALFPDDGTDADVLLRNAESARIRARNERESVLFYRSEMNARVTEHLVMENNLRLAITEKHFLLHYQPRIDLTNGRLCGLEALIRWQHPITGIIPPLKFIHLLEETGLIHAVGEWALEEAISQSRRWRDLGYRVPRIAVNVSALQLSRPDFIDTLLKLLGRYPGAAQELEIEITENMLLGNVDRGVDTLNRIRSEGIAIAIDDFGTGFSSLSYLARLPIDCLKIDQSFIRGLGSEKIETSLVSSIIELAHRLGHRVVAEGVESADQKALLEELGCDEAQGYYYSKPLPAREVLPWLELR